MVHSFGQILLILLTVFSTASCGPRRVFVGGFSMTVDDAARADLDEAKAKRRAGKHEEAAVRFEAVAEAYPDSMEGDEALYGAGLSWEDAEEPVRARAAYERLLERYPSSDKAALAKVRLLALSGSEKEAVARSADAYEQVDEAGKYETALRLAEEAEEAGNELDAFRWRREVLRRAETPADRQTAEGALKRLIDGRLSFLEISKLASEIKDDAFVSPLLQYKLAKIYLHLGKYEELQALLSGFIATFPAHAFTAEAVGLLEKIRRRGDVDPNKIGVVLPLSGNEQRFGEQLLFGIKLAFAGSPFVLVIKDSKGEPTTASQAVESLVYEDQVVAIVGGVLTAEAQALALKASELHVPIVAFSRSEGFTKLGEWVFRDFLTSKAVTKGLLDFAMGARGMTRFAILHPELSYGEEMRDAFWDGVEERGGEIQGVESYKQDETTFSVPIKKLVGRYYLEERQEYASELANLRSKKIEDDRKRRNALEKIRSSLTPVIDFDALFLPDQWKNVALVTAGLAFEDVITNGCDQRDLERIEKTMGKKVKPVMLLGGSLWNSPGLPKLAGKYVNCSVFVDGFYAQSSRPETIRFVEVFRQANGGNPPGLLEAYAFNASTALRTVLEKLRPKRRDEVRIGLLTQKGLSGPMGPIVVTEEREFSHPLYFLTIDRGTIREADPAKREGPP